MAALNEALIADGLASGDAADFLGLPEPERRVIDLKISALKAYRELRSKTGMTQAQVAEAMGTKQPRIAKMEKGHPGFTLDYILMALFAVGGTLADLKPRPRRKPSLEAQPTKGKSVKA